MSFASRNGCKFARLSLGQEITEATGKIIEAC